jgi:hypothetical protein
MSDYASPPIFTIALINKVATWPIALGARLALSPHAANFFLLSLSSCLLSYNSVIISRILGSNKASNGSRALKSSARDASV